MSKEVEDALPALLSESGLRYAPERLQYCISSGSAATGTYSRYFISVTSVGPAVTMLPEPFAARSPHHSLATIAPRSRRSAVPRAQHPMGSVTTARRHPVTSRTIIGFMVQAPDTDALESSRRPAQRSSTSPSSSEILRSGRSSAPYEY